MRANSLNLKKKIAFIASLAMIAGTAAYLPANVAQNFGFGTSIVASATDYTVAVDTFDAFIKVDGQYLVFDSAKQTYSLSDNIGGLKTGVVPCVLNTGGAENAGAHTKGTTGTYRGMGGLAADVTSTDTYLDLFNGDGVVALPNFVEGGAEITVEIVAHEGVLKSENSAYTVALDEDGKAGFTADSKVEIAGDGATYDETTKEPVGGNYEKLNLKGLKFAVSPIAACKGINNGAVANDAAVKKIDINGGSALAVGKYEVTAPAEVKQATVNGKKVYANIVDIALTDAQLPNSLVNFSLDITSNWTASKSQFSVPFGTKGYAETEAFSVSKAGQDTEYYIVRINNPETTISGKTMVTFSSEDGASDVFSTVDLNNPVDEDDEAYSRNANVKYSVERSVTVVDGQYVTLFTVYHNDVNAKYFTLAGATSGETTSKFTNGTQEVTAGDAPEEKAASAGLYVNCLDSEGSGTGNGTSEVLMLAPDGGHLDKYERVQFKFTTDYNIKVDRNDDSGVTTKETTKVTKGVKVTKPSTDPTKAGYTFVGWEIDNNADNDPDDIAEGDVKDVFLAADSANNQQTYDTSWITPNATLKAKYEANTYFLNFDANGGYFRGVPNGLAIKKVGEKSAQYKAVGTNVTVDATTDWGVISTVDATGDNGDTGESDGELVRPGFTLLGWAATQEDAEAGEVLTGDTVKTIRPNESTTTPVTLYAVWKANEVNIALNNMIGIDQDGESFDGSVKASAENAVDNKNKEFVTSTTLTDKNKLALSKGSVKTNTAFGALPTPVLNGYTFEGWYRQVIGGTSAAPAYTVEKVDADTVLDETWFTNPVTGAALTDTSVKLYAKFKQNTNTVTFDLDGGQWGANYKYPVTFKINRTTNTDGKGTTNAGTADQVLTDANRLTFFDEDGTRVDAATLASGATNAPTNGSFYEFQGWDIGTKTKLDAAQDVTDALLALADTSDVTIKANWDATDTTKGAFNFITNADDAFIYQNVGTASEPIYVKAVTANGVDVDGTDGGVTKDVVALDDTGSKNKANEAKFSGENITDKAGRKYVVARPGYTFGGWYTDAECTTEADLSKYPDGKQVKVYAKWTPKATTRYKLRYNLVTADNTIIAPTKDDDNYTTTGGDYKFLTEKMGETGKTIDASELSFDYKDKKYVFDNTLSANLVYRAEIATSFNNKQDAAGKDITAVYDLLSTSADTTVYAYYKDESAVEKKLGTVSATSIKVAEDGTVKWTAADNAVKYKVIKIGSNGKAYAGKETTDTTFKFAAVPTSDYEVQVVAFDKDGNKTTSEKVKVTVKSTGTLGTVDSKTITVGTDRKTVTWTAIEGATSYRVIKTVNGKAYASATVTEPTYTFANVTYSAFSVKVVAMKGTEKTYSDAVNVAVAESADHGKVVNPKVTKDGKVTWEAVEGATSYRVAKFINDKAYYGTEVKAPATEYKFAKVPTDDYKVYVVSYFADGSKTYGTITKVSTKLDAPQNVKLSADNKTVTFDAVEGAVKYQIKKTTVAGKAYYGSKFTGTSVTMGSAATKGMTIQVLAFDAEGNSSLSDGIVVE